MTLPIFPLSSSTPGLAYGVKWEPIFINMPSAITTSGASIDLALASTPIHNFELVFEFLRDYFPASPSISEFRLLFGFFLALGGSVGRFGFSNPDDNVVLAQPVANGDGATTTFTLQRTFGVVEEPVGLLDLTHTFPSTLALNVYLNGTIQSPFSYNLVTTTPMQQQLVFTSAPAGGVAITVDMYFYYYCRFAENKLTFNKFLNQIWDLGKVNLQSCRLGA